MHYPQLLVGCKGLYFYDFYVVLILMEGVHPENRLYENTKNRTSTDKNMSLHYE